MILKGEEFMKKQFKKLSLALVFAMAVSLIAPAVRVADAAEKKTFTYAEQQTGDTVTTLVMDKGEKVDLKFNNVSNWRTYKYKWQSSNSKVAVVDSAGVVTAIGTGVATIKLQISGGDGTQYTSTGVTVYVGLDQSVAIGTSSADEIKSFTIEMGKTATLKANGLKDNVGNRYSFDWSSTDTTVATISDEGVITPKAPGLTVIQLTVKKIFSGVTMKAAPIALLVTEQGGYTPVATATPAPTQKPGATATPTPKPTATPTPTPVVTNAPTATPAPTDQYVAYTATLEADNCLLLKFASPVVYNMSDISLTQMLPAGNGVVEVKWEVLKVTLNKDGTELRIVPILPFNDGEKYIIKAGSADPGKDFNVKLGAPNRLDVSYECLGTPNVAYAYDEEIAIDVPVTLSYRLYYGNVDVTETYKNKGYMTYDFASSSYEENVSLSDNELSFFEPNVSVVLNAVYTYFDENNIEREVKDVVPIRSTKLPSYSIQNRVINWTIIDTTKSDKIDWSNPVHQVVSGMEDAKIVAMLADSYGNYYVNDDRGVDVANNIYSIYDFDALFAKFGYGVEFSAANIDQLIMNSDGTLYPYQAVNNSVILVTLTDSGYNGGNYTTRTIGVCQLKILAESKLSAISAEETKVTLASQALPGFEDRFCETEVEILLKDQYGNLWNGDYDLELTAKEKAVDNALSNSGSSPARLDGTTLIINAENIKAATTSTSVTFTVTETTTKRKVTITATLKKPTMSNNEIKVTGWDLEVDTDTIKLGEMKQNELIQSAVVEAFKTSNNGIKVGLYDDLHIIDTTDYKFTSSCKEGEVYVLVLGPDGKPVDETQDSNGLGVYIDENEKCIRINVSAPSKAGNLSLDSLAAGKYTIKATRIVEERTSTPRTASLTASFTVEDNTKNITYRTVRSTKTSIDVNGNDDLRSVSEIIEELFIFDIDGKEWTEMTADMIVDVDYIINGNYIIVKGVEFAVPVESDTVFTMTYRKTVNNINKSIRIGATN